MLAAFYDKLEDLIASKAPSPSPSPIVALLLVALSLGLAILLHRVLFLSKSSRGGPQQHSDWTTSNREESRLVRKQFGSLGVPDDLLLKEELTETNNNNNNNSQGVCSNEKLIRTSDSSTIVEEETRATASCCTNEKKNNNNSTRRRSQSAASTGSTTTSTTTTQHPHQTANSNKSGPHARTDTAAAAVAGGSRNPPRPVERPPFLRTTCDHPGLEAFWQWCDVEASLFRIYTIPRADGVPDDATTVPPYNPSSRRGNVPIHLRVTNCMDMDDDQTTTIHVYWIDYKGKYVFKGRVAPQETWSQTTWIDHPWVFCAVRDTAQEERILLHYIPYRVIPTTLQAPTVDDDDSSSGGGGGEAMGVHRFRILSPAANSHYCCAVDDPVLPHPARMHIRTPHRAAEFALLHCARLQFADYDLLKRYLTRIAEHPADVARRQIRTANVNFVRLWMSPARGVLLAAGFVEHGAFVELGTDAAALPSDVVQELLLFVAVIESWEKRANDFNNIQQPRGADGYGRAGFGL